MPRSYTLSFAAIDILCEVLRLNPAPFPFEIPRHGQTDQQRAGIRAAVFADLESRDLAYRGRPEGDLDAAVALFARPEVVITIFGKLGRENRLSARICSDGRQALSAIGQHNAVRFEQIHPASLVSTAVGLLPHAPAGEGQSVTFPLSADTEPDQGEGISQMVRAPRNSTAVQAHAAETMLGQPKLRFGQFRITVRRRDNHQDNSPDLFWFDTATGRYVTHRSTTQDGQAWTTFSPTDTPRIGQLLNTQLNRLTVS